LRVVDTSIAVDHLRGHPSAVALLHDQLLAGEPLAASEVVRFELLSGVRDGELSATERLFLAFDWLPVTESVARLAGDLARTYRRSHQGIDAADYLIAATALILDAELLTLNVRHFPMLAGLQAPY